MARIRCYTLLLGIRDSRPGMTLKPLDEIYFFGAEFLSEVLVDCYDQNLYIPTNAPSCESSYTVCINRSPFWENFSYPLDN